MVLRLMWGGSLVKVEWFLGYSGVVLRIKWNDS